MRRRREKHALAASFAAKRRRKINPGCQNISRRSYLYMPKIRLFSIILGISLFALSASGSAFKSYTGKITTTGKTTVPKPVLTISDSVSYLLAGRLLPELKNLQGATVKVKGVPTYMEAYYRLQVLTIKEYRILSLSNGRKPWVGIIDGETDIYLRTAKGKTYPLTGSLVSILALEKGAKVWVTGTAHRSGFFKKIIQPDAYGILRPRG
jgi:hypothetical protein